MHWKCFQINKTNSPPTIAEHIHYSALWNIHESVSLRYPHGAVAYVTNPLCIPSIHFLLQTSVLSLPLSNTPKLSIIFPFILSFVHLHKHVIYHPVYTDDLLEFAFHHCFDASMNMCNYILANHRKCQTNSTNKHKILCMYIRRQIKLECHPHSPAFMVLFKSDRW